MSVDTQWLTTVLLGRQGSDTHHECRHCGTTVDGDAGTCPRCGATEIASYRLG